MTSFVLAVHVILAIFLVTLILLQQGKGADAGAIMGSGSANSLFGAAGASNLLVRLTTITAMLFMLTSILLVRLSNIAGTRTGGSVVQDPLENSVMKGLKEKEQAAAQEAAGITVTVVPVTPSAGETPAVVVPPAAPPAVVPPVVVPQETSAPAVSTPAAGSGK